MRGQLVDMGADVDLRLAFISAIPAGRLYRILEESSVFARKPAPFAQRLEPIGIEVLIDQRRQRADLFELRWRRHQHTEIVAQPAPIIKPVLRGEANTGCAQVLKPADDVLTFEVCAVWMSQREVVRADAALAAPSNGNAADISSAPRPGGAAITAQAFVVGLSIDCDQVDVTQIGQAALRLPVGHGVGP